MLFDIDEAKFLEYDSDLRPYSALFLVLATREA